MCKEADQSGEPEVTRIPSGIPEPGQKPGLPENPLNPTRHLTKYSTQNTNLDGKDELPDLELSEVTDSKGEE
ncbi:hypothetical protein TVAG_390310 [Trichomonas vaginalis G3]|uniref:Uncharacterized protein n=1 Tax=Trichomonas vaginalis (strain ATCC PRA-98 / G3) TaxID=412133 RepID=A2EST5_TRIV3|nr:hypothetical protein TVAGG3_0181920 [Trichomonas vaginalis G3]EAY04261.1 hypothetical protein TVAG_390310 [Trichomonas vaginalis G3]KAI5549354.1 hypothetical protein TVAGG3_0181920 [Trichomonas vaginalis G3]|eukprot:XP_001316484.1 hypothetical protein [Trichomonas vaginalis G3]